MQKKLLAMAVGAALAAPATVTLAQSSVQVYGTVHMSLNSTRYSSSTAGVGGVRKWAVNSHASNYGLRSTESLGGGLTAWFQAEFNMKLERENDIASGQGTARNSGVGLRGSWGNAYVGVWESPWAQLFRLWDVGTIGGYGPNTSIIGRRETTGHAVSRNCGNAFQGGSAVTTGSIPTAFCGTAEAGTVGGVAGAYPHWRRLQNAFFYESPNFGGFQAKIGIMTNESKAVSTATVPGTTTAATAENPSIWSGSLTWTGMGGRARVGLGNMRYKDGSTVGQTDSGWTLVGGYDFGVVNVGAAMERYTYKTATGDSRARQYGIGAAIPAGSGKVGISYARARDISGGALAGDNGAKMWNVGYEWALSKRTALGFGYSKITNDTAAVFTWTGMAPIQDGVGATPLAGSDPSNLFVSIRHSF